jgi:transcriptional regulator with XRE-family HTH domain
MCTMADEFGKYVRSLRQERGISLRYVGEKASISSSYLAQIEKGRRRPPGPEILKRLAPVYDVPLRDLMRAAGYLEEARPDLGEEEEVELAFRYVMSDPRYKSGTRVKGELTTDIKRFIVEIYEKATGKKLLPGG